MSPIKENLLHVINFPRPKVYFCKKIKKIFSNEPKKKLKHELRDTFKNTLFLGSEIREVGGPYRCPQ